ncbi:hypothetical protein [Sporosarcina sp. SAFN-010]|uniref:hypothetical protein n=1 Tax=Sporosarcina sp. SAFN-010 TaxID=3387273 RepID=UPI003F7E6076
MDWNWNETSIKLLYTSENLRTLLGTVCKKENEFTQYDFAMWCDNLTMVFGDDELNEYDSLALGIARAIECQWDLFWDEKELKKMDQSKLELPFSWFIEWSKELSE